jgi:hypothetical protein
MATKKIKETVAIAKQTAPLLTLASLNKAATPFFTGLAKHISEALSFPESLPPIQAELTSWIKVLEDAKDAVSGRLKAMVLEQGTVKSEKGSKELVIGEFKLECRPRKTGYDAKKVQFLLQNKGLSLSEHMDAEISYSVNQEKLVIAQERGLITADELKTCGVDVQYNLQAPKRVDG